jgi:hypothetical protein
MTLTATAEPETVPQPAEPPVFAAITPARPRALRLAGRITAGLVGLWLVALVLGTFGFGPVAGIGLPRIGGSDNAVHRAAVRKAPTPRPGERVTRSGVTLTTRSAGTVATPAGTHRSGPTGASHRSAARPAPSPSSHTGTGGSSGSQAGSGSAGATHTPVPSPASSSTATSATPTSTTTTQTTSNSHSTHSQATPPGSSSATPGSRSNAGTAPGRDQSASTPTPGSGRTEHAPPKG